MNHEPSKILIVGSGGQVGAELKSCLTPPGIPSNWAVVALDRRGLDITDKNAVQRVIDDVRPTVIVNATGYTAVDQAESDPTLAQRVNRDGAAHLAHAAARAGSAIIQYSTDYVFDGTSRSPYVPTDEPNPQSAYARSKRDGELAVIDSGARYVIVRTQWVYGLRARNFAIAILQQAMKRPELRIVSDQVGSPTWSRSIARATIQMILTGLEGRDGIYHLACGGTATWFDFASALLQAVCVRHPEFPIPKLVPVTTSEYGARAARPAYSVLDCSKTEQVFGIEMPLWTVALAEALDDEPALRAIINAPVAAPR